MFTKQVLFRLTANRPASGKLRAAANALAGGRRLAWTPGSFSRAAFDFGTGVQHHSALYRWTQVGQGVHADR